MENRTEKLELKDGYLKRPFWERAKPYLVIAPALLLTIGILYPFGMAVYYSLTNLSFRRPTVRFTGFANWGEMFREPSFWHAVWVTVKYVIDIQMEAMCNPFLGLTARNVAFLNSIDAELRMRLEIHEPDNPDDYDDPEGVIQDVCRHQELGDALWAWRRAGDA